MIEIIRQPWPWYVSGAVIAFIMFMLLFFGKSFGFSSNFRTICAACGAGKVARFFDFDWRGQQWNLVFLVGSVIGGFITSQYLSDQQPVQISESTIQDLSALGIDAPAAIQPLDLFNFDFLLTWQGFIMLVLGGFLVGFGARYAGGCTSGHAISGMSNLQWPSLLAVVGFFIGGLITTFIILPFIF